MKAKLLLKINILLGIMAAFLAGCHTTKPVPRDRGPIAMYGVPDAVQMGDTLPSQQPEQQPEQQVEEQKPPYNGHDFEPRKYGPLPPRS